jgi:hypothetical protein
MNELKPSVDLIDTFLGERSWTRVEGGERFKRYRPGPKLGLAAEYTLSVPIRADLPGAAEVLNRVVTTLSQVHDLSRDQLGIVLSVPDTVVSVQVEDESTRTGSMPLRRFEDLIERLRKALLDTASFVLTDAPILDEKPQAADRYLDHCRFLQTEVGSFVAKVQLPSAEKLEDASFFKTEGVFSDEVNERFAGVVDFAVNRAMAVEPELLLASIQDAPGADVVTVNVLSDLNELYERSGADAVNFRFLSAQSHREFPSGRLDDAKLRRFSDFVSLARQTYSADKPLVIEGKIVELRSRNPKGNKNHVVLQGIDSGKVVFVAFTLGKSDFWYANQAFGEGKSVRVAGSARQMKTQLRIKELELFQVLE